MILAKAKKASFSYNYKHITPQMTQADGMNFMTHEDIIIKGMMGLLDYHVLELKYPTFIGLTISNWNS